MIDDDEIAAYVLSKVLGCDRDRARWIIAQLDEEGWELREYKYHMTPARWEQMAERNKGKNP